MVRVFFLICVLCLVCLVPVKTFAAGPGTNGQANSLSQASAQNTSYPIGPYRLGPNDFIKVQVFGQPELSLEMRVSGDGKVRMPMLGVVEVQGLSVEETESLFTQQLSERFLKNPRVAVYIVKYRNFYVSGQVKNPGGYPYEEGLTVRRALMLAGGVTDKASKCAPGVQRPNKKDIVNVQVTLDDTVLPDDMLVVPECQNFYVSGEVRTPGVYTHEDGMTVLKAIMLAGGFTNKASEGRIKIKRLKGSRFETISVKLEDSVFPEDVLLIPESFF